MPTPNATLEFLPGWQQEQQGAITRGGTLTLNYDKTRLADCFPPWRGAELGDIVARCRFHPRGDITAGSVVSSVLELPVPVDATQAEIWFENFSQTSSPCEAWDSRFGQNYWFNIDGPPPRLPMPAVSYRSGAVTRPEIVNVQEHHAVKVNAFPAPPIGSRDGTDLRTTLAVVAWVQKSPYGANAWIDVHVFDNTDQLIQASTLAMDYAGYGPVFRYQYSGVVYQGSTATPGSVQPRPDARTVQYRLYYALDYQVFTDGILHQLDLPEDAVTR
jgi:uncharacterized protein DUF6209